MEEQLVQYIKNIEYEFNDRITEESTNLNINDIKDDINIDEENNNLFRDLNNNNQNIKKVNREEIFLKEKNENEIICNNNYDIIKDNIENSKMNKISLLYKNSNQVIEKNIKLINVDSFIFNGKTFKKYYRDNKYKKEDRISRLIFKCIYHRKDEKIRIELKKSYFCNVTIILPGQNKKVDIS